jgi:hypothetical protein
MNPSELASELRAMARMFEHKPEFYDLSHIFENYALQQMPHSKARSLLYKALVSLGYVDIRLLLNFSSFEAEQVLLKIAEFEKVAD